MPFRSFQSRVVLSFLLLITLVQVGALIAVNSAIERSARAHVEAELDIAAKVVGRLIEARKERLVEAARILSADFPFKQVVALGDRDTLRSAIDNHRARIGADLMMVLSLDGTRVVDSLQRDALASHASPPALSGLVAAADREGELSDFVLLNGRPYQIVIVPLLAPAPIAWIGMGFPIDRTLAEELRKITSSHVSFVHVLPGRGWSSVASTLAVDERRPLIEALDGRESAGVEPASFTLPGSGPETLVVPLPSSAGVGISVALQRTLADAMAPFRFLRGALLALFVVAAVVSAIGGVWVARGVSRPVRQLAEAARMMEAGEYGRHVSMTRQDELGDLAATFNRMTSAVAEREERLRESEERFRAMTESATDAVISADSRGDIVSWNRGAQVMFGYTAGEVLDTPLSRLVPERYQDLGPGELHGLRSDGREFPIEVSLATWETRRGSFRTAIIRDVTERKQLEERFRQAQKMESIGRLAGGVAHDFNNLLTVISGYAQLLRWQLDAEWHPKIQMIDDAAAHAADLTRQLLAFSRQQVLAPEILDLNAVIARVGPMLRRLIGEDVQLVIVPARTPVHVAADPAQMTQILFNLAVNARDAMPGGGKLTIETAPVELDEALVEQHADARPGPSVMLAVTDTGVGMDEETRSHVFEPFFTTKAVGQGTGLGLATVYGIVKQSNGAIALSSAPGRGTTFKIYLPRVEEAAASAAVTEVAADLSGSETILLVEDNEMVRTFVCEILRSRGYTVLEARHGADALDITRRYHGPIHLLVTDVVMPEMGGRELAGRLAAERPQMHVLYMSGYAPDAVGRQGVVTDPDAFVSKPVTADALLRKVRGLLSGPRRA